MAKQTKKEAQAQTVAMRATPAKRRGSSWQAILVMDDGTEYVMETLDADACIERVQAIAAEYEVPYDFDEWNAYYAEQHPDETDEGGDETDEGGDETDEGGDEADEADEGGDEADEGGDEADEEEAPPPPVATGKRGKARDQMVETASTKIDVTKLGAGTPWTEMLGLIETGVGKIDPNGLIEAGETPAKALFRMLCQSAALAARIIQIDTNGREGVVCYGAGGKRLQKVVHDSKACASADGRCVADPKTGKIPAGAGKTKPVDADDDDDEGETPPPPRATTKAPGKTTGKPKPPPVEDPDDDDEGETPPPPPRAGKTKPAPTPPPKAQTKPKTPALPDELAEAKELFDETFDAADKTTYDAAYEYAMALGKYGKIEGVAGLWKALNAAIPKQIGSKVAGAYVAGRKEAAQD